MGNISRSSSKLKALRTQQTRSEAKAPGKGRRKDILPPSLEKPLGLFQKELESLRAKPQQTHVICYRGEKGCGKSRLLGEIAAAIGESAYNVTLDLKRLEYASESAVIIGLSRHLKQKYGFTFPFTEYAILTKLKAFGEFTKLTETEYKEAIGKSELISQVGLLSAPGVFEASEENSGLIEYINSNLAELSMLVSTISSDDEKKISEYFHLCFIHDLRYNLSLSGKPLVVMLDSYEELLADSWLLDSSQDGVISQLGNVLWILASVKELPSYDNRSDVSDFEIGKLTAEETFAYVTACGVKDLAMARCFHSSSDHGNLLLIDILLDAYLVSDLERLSSYSGNFRTFVEDLITKPQGLSKYMSALSLFRDGWDDRMAFSLLGRMMDDFDYNHYYSLTGSACVHTDPDTGRNILLEEVRAVYLRDSSWFPEKAAAASAEADWSFDYELLCTHYTLKAKTLVSDFSTKGTALISEHLQSGEILEAGLLFSLYTDPVNTGEIKAAEFSDWYKGRFSEETGTFRRVKGVRLPSALEKELKEAIRSYEEYLSFDKEGMIKAIRMAIGNQRRALINQERRAMSRDLDEELEDLTEEEIPDFFFEEQRQRDDYEFYTIEELYSSYLHDLIAEIDDEVVYKRMLERGKDDTNLLPYRIAIAKPQLTAEILMKREQKAALKKACSSLRKAVAELRKDTSSALPLYLDPLELIVTSEGSPEECCSLYQERLRVQGPEHEDTIRLQGLVVKCYTGRLILKMEQRDTIDKYLPLAFDYLNRLEGLKCEDKSTLFYAEFCLGELLSYSDRFQEAFPHLQKAYGLSEVLEEEPEAERPDEERRKLPPFEDFKEKLRGLKTRSILDVLSPDIFYDIGMVPYTWLPDQSPWERSGTRDELIDSLSYCYNMRCHEKFPEEEPRTAFEKRHALCHEYIDFLKDNNPPKIGNALELLLVLDTLLSEQLTRDESIRLFEDYMAYEASLDLRLPISTRSYEVVYLLGSLYVAKAEKEKGQRTYQKAEQLLSLADSYSSMKLTDEAELLKEWNINANSQLSKLYLLYGKREKSIGCEWKCLEQVRRKDGDCFTDKVFKVLQSLSTSYRTIGRYESAAIITYYSWFCYREPVLKSRENSELSFYRLAELLFKCAVSLYLYGRADLSQAICRLCGKDLNEDRILQLRRAGTVSKELINDYEELFSSQRELEKFLLSKTGNKTAAEVKLADFNGLLEAADAKSDESIRIPDWFRNEMKPKLSEAEKSVSEEEEEQDYDQEEDDWYADNGDHGSDADEAFSIRKYLEEADMRHRLFSAFGYDD